MALSLELIPTKLSGKTDLVPGLQVIRHDTWNIWGRQNEKKSPKFIDDRSKEIWVGVLNLGITNNRAPLKFQLEIPYKNVQTKVNCAII